MREPHIQLPVALCEASGHTLLIKTFSNTVNNVEALRDPSQPSDVRVAMSGSLTSPASLTMAAQ